MNDPILDSWVSESGLTKEECAMIQPMYGSYPVYISDDYNHISPAYGVTSSILGGISLSTNIINGIQIAKGTESKTAPIIGLIAGATQITLGAAHYPKEETDYYGRTYFNKGERNLSLFNIGFGTTSLLLSTWDLVGNKAKKENALSWNVYSYPAQGNNMGVGLYLSRKF